jgi:hypothetical protein
MSGLKPIESQDNQYDIRVILRDLIQEHIQETSNPEEYANYTNIPTQSLNLHELFMSDLQPLRSNKDSLLSKYISQEIKFVEVEGGTPQITVFNSKNKKKPIIVAISNRFLPLIHEAMSVMQMLVLFDRHTGVLNKHKEIVDSDEFSDENLYRRFCHAVEQMYKADFVDTFTKSSFDYFYDPFDLSEIVKGVRLFVICHELAHVIIPFLIDGEIDSKLEEYLADSLALKMILSTYPVDIPHGAILYEFRNVMKGIFLYLTLLGKVESFYGMYGDRTHPYANTREIAVFNILIQDPRIHTFHDLCVGIVEDFSRSKTLKLFELFNSNKTVLLSLLNITQDPIMSKLYKKYQGSYYLAHITCLFGKNEFEIHQDFLKTIYFLRFLSTQFKSAALIAQLTILCNTTIEEEFYLSECDEAVIEKIGISLLNKVDNLDDYLNSNIETRIDFHSALNILKFNDLIFLEIEKIVVNIVTQHLNNNFAYGL